MGPTDSALRAAVHDAARAGQLDEQVARRALAVLGGAPEGRGLAALSAAGLPPGFVEWLVGTTTQPDRPTLTTPHSTASGTPGSGGSLSMSSRVGPGKLPAGSRVGPFVVETELGRGGMGVVMRARDDAGRAVALKLVLGLRENTLKRFSRETAALAKLDHPNVVRYVGSGETPVPWLAMELIEGQDLKALIEGKARVSHANAARLLEGVARGVAHAHSHGIIHRDLKPSNVLVRHGGEPVVTDFGLAKSLDASRFTQSGAMLGTLSTMSPEQVLGLKVGPPTDVWALGVMLYQGLTGRSPFDDETAMSLSAAIVQDPIKPPRAIDSSVPVDLDATCRACLERQPGLRPTALAVARALRERRSPVSARAPRASRLTFVLGAASVVAVIGGLAIVAVTRGAPPAVTVPVTDTRPPVEVGRVVAPWGLAGDGWSVAWSLAHEQAPEVPAPSLWDEPGRRAAPLAAVLEDRPGARAAALLGAARTTSAGRLAVRYDLPRALSPAILSPAQFAQRRPSPHPVMQPLTEPPGAIVGTADNDTTLVDLLVGAARWHDPAVSLAWRRVERVDGDDLAIRLGGPSGPLRCLSFSGRKESAQTDDGGESIPAPWSEAWRRVRYSPGDLPGTRVVLDDAALPVLDAAASKRPGPGRIALRLGEARIAFADLEVEGALGRPDVLALAWAPTSLPAHARVAASFVRTASRGALGGPLVVLGSPDGARFELEADGDQLVLRRGTLPVAAASLGVAAEKGYLLLERLEGDVVRGLLVTDGAQVEVRVTDPLPFDTTLRAAWGSSAPTVRFTAVEAHASGPRPVSEAVAAWRGAALLLARTSDPSWFDDALLGADRAPARRSAAAAAADALEQAIHVGLSGSARDDALARCVLARVVAADAPGAREAARRALDALGASRARELVDALEWTDGHPALLGHLAGGYTTVYDLPVRDAALGAAELLVQERLGEVLAARASNARHRKLAQGSPEQRAAYEEAVVLFERALEAGATSFMVDGPYADTLMDLGRYAEALVVWDRAIATQPTLWWAWFRKADCLVQLGDASGALESVVGALAHAPLRPQVHELLLALVEQGPPGLSACALMALAEVSGEPTGGPLRAAALGRARAAAREDSRDGDLGRYALAREGGPPMTPRRRPTAVLARARAGAPDAREALAAAAREEALVRHLARLDPVVAPLLGGSP